MSKEKSPLIDRFASDFVLLVEGGHIAMKQKDKASAEKLFAAARLLNPTHSAPVMGLGFIGIYCMDLAGARRYFEEALTLDPELADAMVMIGFCCIMTKVGYTKYKTKAVKAEEVDDIAERGAVMVKEAMASPKASAEVKQFGVAALELLEKIKEYRDTPLSSSKK